MEDLIKTIKNGGVGVIPTDTIYGLVGSALNKKAVQRIYKARKRNLKKPLIILISKISDLNLFGVDKIPKKDLSRAWPNKISIILPLSKEGILKYKHLHRGTKKLAFRLPKNKKLLQILKKTGPLVAPSANFEGEKPAENIKEAEKYFKDSIDFYYGKQTLKGAGSTLLEFDGEKFSLKREGAVSLIRLKRLNLI